MELLFGIVVAANLVVMAFFFGFKFGLGAAVGRPKLASNDGLMAQAYDQHRMLETWRREIANILVWEDPDRYLGLYESLHAQVSAYRDWKVEALRAKHAELCTRYPRIGDFDAISTRMHVLYRETLAVTSIEELESKFADLARFQAALRGTEPSWRFVVATSDNDLDHLRKYVLQIKDTKFRLRLERAISDYCVWRASDHAERLAELIFEYANMVIRPVSHFAENRYGIHFKDTNEFGLYGFFISDHGRMHNTYYRSDSTFQEEKHLDFLHAVADDRREPGSRSRLELEVSELEKHL